MSFFRFNMMAITLPVTLAVTGCAISSHKTTDNRPPRSTFAGTHSVQKPAASLATADAPAKPNNSAAGSIPNRLDQPDKSGAGDEVALASHTNQQTANQQDGDADPTKKPNTIELKPLVPPVPEPQEPSGTGGVNAPLPTNTEMGPALSIDELDGGRFRTEMDLAATGKLGLQSVIDSVYVAYPMLEAALFSRNIATGEQIYAQGAFDRKLKGASQNGAVGFYETFRQNIGIVKPLYGGGELFAGYRVGRGSFEPWYKERETNGGGEFKAGFYAPLLRNNDIDARRAELWRTQYGRQLVEPEIQAQLIGFVQEGSYAYWEWVAAGARYEIADRVLGLAEDRTDRIRTQVQGGFVDPPELTDNLRLIAERRAKLAESLQKFQKAAIKLSLYHRDQLGQPIVPRPERLPEFPDPILVQPDEIPLTTKQALDQRPEIAVLELVRRQLGIDLAEARNDLQPNLDTQFVAAQDMGVPTSSKNDKGDFELEASLFLDVPLERRKAKGKIRMVQGKMAQLQAKLRLTEDKIITDVQMAYAALLASYERIKQTQEAVAFAEDLARRERRNQELGASDLLKVTLREQYAVEAALKAVDALEAYFKARADYRAAIAEDRL